MVQLQEARAPRTIPETSAEVAPSARPASPPGVADRRARLSATRRKHRTIRRLATTLAGCIVAGFATAVLVAITVPALFGYHAYVVRSGSMEPLIATGDVVIDRTIPPLDAHVGDTVTFRDPDNQHRLVTHRVQAIVVQDAKASFTTMGVANNTPEQWKVATAGHIGRVEYRIPKLGWLLAATSTPAGKLGFIVLPTLALGALAILRIWRPRDSSAAPK